MRDWRFPAAAVGASQPASHRNMYIRQRPFITAQMFDGRESEDERETGRAPGGAPSNQTDFTLVEFNLDFQEKRFRHDLGEGEGARPEFRIFSTSSAARLDRSSKENNSTGTRSVLFFLF